MEMRKRGRKKRILEDRGEKMPHMRNGRRTYRIRKIGLGDVLDERGKGEVVKWMRG